jgi:hypothetical protein
MTLPTFQGIGTGSETSCSWPTHAADDWGILLVEHGGGTVATPTGCSIVAGFPINQGGGSIFSAFKILATGSSMPALALSGGSNHMWGTIFTVRGAHLTTPIHAFGGAKQSGTSANGYAPIVVTDEADCLIVPCLAWGGDAAGPMSAGSIANAALGSVTSQYDAGTLTGDGGGLIIGSGTLATAGSTGMTTWTLTTTPFSSATLAFRPAGAVAAFTFAGTATIDGDPAPNGATVYVVDHTNNVIETSTTVAGGAGAFTVQVLSNSANYRAVIDTGTSYGASPIDQAV